jgi:hypothetical protein
MSRKKIGRMTIAAILPQAGRGRERFVALPPFPYVGEKGTWEGNLLPLPMPEREREIVSVVNRPPALESFAADVRT